MARNDVVDKEETLGPLFSQHSKTIFENLLKLRAFTGYHEPLSGLHCLLQGLVPRMFS